MVWVYTRDGVEVTRDDIYDMLVAELGIVEAMFALDIVLDDDEELGMHGITRAWIK